MRLDGVYLDSQFSRPRARRKRPLMYWLAKLRRWLRRGGMYLYG